MLAIEKLPKREEGKGAAKVVLEAGGLRGRHTIGRFSSQSPIAVTQIFSLTQDSGADEKISFRVIEIFDEKKIGKFLINKGA